MYTNEEVVLVSWCKNVASSLMVCSISLFCLLLLFLLLSFLLLPVVLIFIIYAEFWIWATLYHCHTSIFMTWKDRRGKKGINGPMPDLEELIKFCNVKLKQTLMYLDKMKANKEPESWSLWNIILWSTVLTAAVRSNRSETLTVEL